MRSEAASRRRRYSTTLGQGASLRSAPTRWPRKLSGDGGSAADIGSGRTARLSASTYGKTVRGIGPPSLDAECTAPAAAPRPPHLPGPPLPPPPSPPHRERREN